MKKRNFLTLIAVVLFLMVMPVVKAAEQPTYVDDRNIAKVPLFFANGTPITIEERTDGQDGAVIKWNGGEQLVPKTVHIYGAGHESDTRYETTNITMNGGIVGDIFGGGLHKSNVGTTNITINGGTHNSVSGGGAASASTTKCHKPWYNEDAKNSPNRVDNANVIINGGTSKTTVYGGGEGISYTGTAKVTINDGTMLWVTAGGSNGYTGSAEVSVLGGTIDTLQSVNRGSMKNTTMDITGGKITNLVGGTKGAGVIEEVKVAVEGGDVTNLLVGTIGGTQNGNGETAKDVVKVSYNKKYVENVDESTFNEEAITQTVTLTFAVEDKSKAIEIPYGASLTKEKVNELINTLGEELKAAGYTIEDFYTDEALTVKYDFTQPIEKDTTIYMNLVELKDEVPATAPQEVENAKTGDMNLIIVLSLLGLAVAAVTITGKKVFLNNNI